MSKKLFCLMLGLGLLAFSPVCAKPINLYVSPDGNGNKFTKVAPGSLLSAKEKVKTLRTDMKADINIWLLSGTYQLAAPIAFEAGESGLNGFSVIYKAAPGAKPVISGGKIITGWVMHDAAKTIYQAPVPDSFQTRDFFVNGIRSQRACGEDKTTGNLFLHIPEFLTLAQNLELMDFPEVQTQILILKKACVICAVIRAKDIM